MVNTNLQGPRGWTLKNNPYPPEPSQRVYNCTDEKGTHWSDWFEWLPDGTKICHTCIKRARYGSGNCQDGGEYFICLPKEVREGKKTMPKRTVQSKLVI